MKIAKALVVAAGLGFTSTGHALVIDNFNSNSGAVTQSFGSPAPGSTFVSGLVADVLGGGRALLLDNIWSDNGTPGNTGDDFLSNDAGASSRINQTVVGALTHNLESGTARADLTVTWDANGAGLGGLDLTADGSDALQLDILAVDQGDVDLILEISTSTGIGSKALTNIGVGQHSFFFTDLVGTFDLASVNSISLKVEAQNASDLTLDLLQTRQGLVPAPGVLSLLGIGLIGLAGLRQRKAYVVPGFERGSNRVALETGSPFLIPVCGMSTWACLCFL